jgi:hypothetical protein
VSPPPLAASRPPPSLALWTSYLAGTPPPPPPPLHSLLSAWFPHALLLSWSETLAALGVARRQQPRSWDWPEWAPVRRVSDAEASHAFPPDAGRR